MADVLSDGPSLRPAASSSTQSSSRNDLEVQIRCQGHEDPRQWLIGQRASLNEEEPFQAAVAKATVNQDDYEHYIRQALVKFQAVPC